jgi:hypothetical protein
MRMYVGSEQLVQGGHVDEPAQACTQISIMCPKADIMLIC